MGLGKIDLRCLKQTEIVKYDNQANFNKYLTEIGKLRPLSREEEIETFKEIELTGSKVAIDKICKHNMLFVISVARRMYKIIPKSTSLTFEDLVSEGNMGLCVAVQRFDYKTGNKFISYAVWYIKQHMLACIQAHIKTIRIPNSARLIVTNFYTIEELLEQKLTRKPTISEVFDEMVKEDKISSSYDKSKLEELLKMSRFESSLNEIVGESKNETKKIELCELIKNDDEPIDEQYVLKERYSMLHNMMESLPHNIKTYLNDFYGLDGKEPLTLKQMSEKHDESPDVISSRIKKYLRFLKAKNKDKKEFFFPAPDYEELIRDRDENTIYCI